jgi:hypothetical protein
LQIGQSSLAQLLAACPADGLHKITEWVYTSTLAKA